MKSIFDEQPSSSGSRGQKSLRIVASVGLLALIYAMGSTLAANISVGTGDTEFGQGIQVTTACDNQITVTPKANFNNSATPSLLPTLALELIDGALSFSVLNTSGTYSTTQSGFTIATNSASSVTINFTTPVAMSCDVTLVTLESSNAIPVQMVVTYSIGSVGPGGGTIFYVDSNGFNCGSSFSSTGSPTGGLCKYLEAAPVTWSGSSDPSKVWSTVGFTTTDIAGISNDSFAYNNAAAIGLGHKNSTLIVGQGNTSASAAGSARAYAGGGKSDGNKVRPIRAF